MKKLLWILFVLAIINYYRCEKSPFSWFRAHKLVRSSFSHANATGLKQWCWTMQKHSQTFAQSISGAISSLMSPVAKIAQRGWRYYMVDAKMFSQHNSLSPWKIASFYYITYRQSFQSHWIRKWSLQSTFAAIYFIAKVWISPTELLHDIFNTKFIPSLSEGEAERWISPFSFLRWFSH